MSDCITLEGLRDSHRERPPPIRFSFIFPIDKRTVARDFRWKFKEKGSFFFMHGCLSHEFVLLTVPCLSAWTPFHLSNGNEDSRFGKKINFPEIRSVWAALLPGVTSVSLLVHCEHGRDWRECVEKKRRTNEGGEGKEVSRKKEWDLGFSHAGLGKRPSLFLKSRRVLFKRPIGVSSNTTRQVSDFD